MKRIMLAGLAVCAGVCLAHAAMPTVVSVEKVALPDGMKVSAATLSPDGTHAVVTPLSGVGLDYVSLADGKVTEISKNGSQLMLQFSADGSNVVYRETTHDQNHRLFATLKSFNVADGTSQTLVQPTRNLQGFAVDGNTAVAVNNGSKAVSTIKANATASGRAALSIDRGKLCVTDKNGTREIRPLGNMCGSYLWPALSPDGKRIVAFGVGTGTFVCDLNGDNVTVLGMYRAPQWLDNETVVAMDDYDNGVVTVKSTIMALSADGAEKVALTGDEYVGVFPTPAPGKVAFTTPQGEFYIINLK